MGYRHCVSEPSHRFEGFLAMLGNPQGLNSGLNSKHDKMRRNPLLENGCDPGSNPGRSIERSETIRQDSGTSELAF